MDYNYQAIIIEQMQKFFARSEVYRKEETCPLVHELPFWPLLRPRLSMR